MLRMLLCLFAVLLAQPGTAAPLRVAMEGQFPPFEELDAQGNLVGFNVDIANALCQRMQRECELQRFAWEELIPALEDGRADLILASMSITAARANGWTSPPAMRRPRPSSLPARAISIRC